MNYRLLLTGFRYELNLLIANNNIIKEIFNWPN